MLARERWQTFEESGEKTQYLMNTLYKIKRGDILTRCGPCTGGVTFGNVEYGMVEEVLYYRDTPASKINICD